MSKQCFRILCFQVINLIFLLSGSVEGSFVVVDVSNFFFIFCVIFGGGEGLCGFLIGLGVGLFWFLFNN